MRLTFLNPAWHGHARFHGALLLFLLAGVSLTGVWLLWRESKEPEVAVKAAALMSASFWTPLFYIRTWRSLPPFCFLPRPHGF